MKKELKFSTPKKRKKEDAEKLRSKAIYAKASPESYDGEKVSLYFRDKAGPIGDI
jgi:hypothetical protein